MKKINKTNLIFYFSIIFFIITCSLHVFNKKRVAQAIPFVGSAGGRIAVVFLTPPPTPTGPCVGFPCACSVTLTTAIIPYGGMGSTFCFPVVNMPLTGPPITVASVGYQIRGFWTMNEPTAVSINWGTSL